MIDIATDRRKTLKKEKRKMTTCQTTAIKFFLLLLYILSENILEKTYFILLRCYIVILFNFAFFLELETRKGE